MTLSVALSATPAAPAAASATPRPARPGFSLTVSPSRLIVPADQLARPRQFTVTNQTRTPVDVVVRLASFAAGPDGELVFRPNAPHSAAEWVTIRPDRFRLAGGAAEQISLRIAVPNTAEPGEHQVAAIFSVPAPAGETGIGVQRAVGAPIYVTVPGDAVDSVDISGLRAPGFALGGPLAFTATVRNAGTMHRDFLGDDRLSLRVAGVHVPFSDFTLLRGASREINAQWSNPPLLCLCRATVTVPNPDGTARSVAATTVVLSPHLIGVGTALVLVLPLGWLLLRRRRATR